MGTSRAILPYLYLEDAVLSLEELLELLEDPAEELVEEPEEVLLEEVLPDPLGMII